MRPLGGVAAAVAAAVVGVALGAAIATDPVAPLLLVPLLIAAIGFLATLRQERFDIVVWLVAGAAFLLPMNNVRLGSNLTVGDGLVVVALVLVIVIRVSEREVAVAGLGKLVAGVMVVVFGGLLGSFFAASVGASISTLAKFGLATVALPVLFGLWRPTVAALRIVGWALVLGSTMSAGAGLVALRVVGRAKGFTTHPNHLALASLMAVGVGCGLLLSTSERLLRLVLFIALVVLSVGVVRSGSRSGLVAEGIVLALVALLTHHRVMVATLLGAGAALGVFAASGRLSAHGNSALARLLGGGGAGVSDQARGATLHAAYHAFALHPFSGQGFQAALETHDIVLEMAATAGLFGIAGLLYIVWLALRPMWSRFHWGAVRSPWAADRLLAGTVAAVAGFFVNGLFGNQLYDRYIWIVITMAVALAVELDQVPAGLEELVPRAALPW